MKPAETVETDSPKIACEGESPALGHPRVYLNMGDKREIDCPYCGRRFVLKEGAKVSGGH